MFLDEKRRDEFHHNTEEVSTYCRVIFVFLVRPSLQGFFIMIHSLNRGFAIKLKPGFQMMATIAVIAVIAEKKHDRNDHSDHMKPLSSDRSDNSR